MLDKIRNLGLIGAVALCLSPAACSDSAGPADPSAANGTVDPATDTSQNDDPSETKGLGNATPLASELSHDPDDFVDSFLQTDEDDDLDLSADYAGVDGNAAAAPPAAPEVEALVVHGACHAGGLYCGGDKVAGDAHTLYKCVSGSKGRVVSKCAKGCVVESASDDHCKSSVTLLAWGLYPAASDALRRVGVSASRIVQTIGNAAASAGTHGVDGFANGKPYSAATDISVRGLSDTDVRKLISRLDSAGFAAFYRNPGHDGWPASEARHVHAIYVGCHMKSSLRAQVSDFLAGRNGLVGHAHYFFYQPSATQRAIVRKLYGEHN